MTAVDPVLFYKSQFSGLSHTALYIRDFKHLWTEPVIHKGLSHSSPAPIPSRYVAQSPRRSMVTKRPSSNATPRSAGQATSPQNTSRSAPSRPPGSQRASPSIEHTRHGNSSRTTSSTVNNMRCSPEPISESDSYSDGCNCSDSEAEHDFSSRATSPDDDYDDIGEDALARRKRQIVDSTMLLFRCYVYKWFAEYCGIITANGGEGGRGTKRSADKMSGKKSANQLSSGGNKRHLRSDGGGVGEEEDSEEEGGGKLHKKAKQDAGLKYACPYFKHDRAKYQKWRTCCGPGFRDSHRVKEHLWRKHRMPKHFCEECNEVFENNAQLNTHCRTSTNCSEQRRSPPDGVDETKERLIRARHKSSLSEPKKWESIYRILFPDDDIIPLPYYEDEEKEKDVPEDRSRVAHYFRTYVFPKVRRDMEREVDQEFEGVSERVRYKALAFIENAIFQTLRTEDYTLQQSPLSPSPRPDFGLASPEPEGFCAPPQQPQPPAPLFDLSFNPVDANYTFSGYDSFGLEGFPQSLQDLLATRPGDDGCASVGNQDSAYETVRDEYAVGIDVLQSLGFEAI